MSRKKGVAISLAEVKTKKPACTECRRKKKRCGHRDDVTLASGTSHTPGATANAANGSAATDATPVPDSPAAGVAPPMDPAPALEGDQGRTPTNAAASGAGSSAAAIWDAPDTPEQRPLKRLMISAPRRPTPVLVPDDSGIGGAATLAENVVMAKELAKRLEEFEAKYQASMAAHQAVMDAGKAVKDAVGMWRGVWAAGR